MTPNLAGAMFRLSVKESRVSFDTLLRLQCNLMVKFDRGCKSMPIRILGVKMCQKKKNFKKRCKASITSNIESKVYLTLLNMKEIYNV